MPTDRVILTFPGRMADDPRYTVTFVESEFPTWPVSLHFLLIGTDRNDATDYFNVGIEIGNRFKSKPGEPRTPIETLPKRRIDPAVLRHVVDNYAVYERRARQQLHGGSPPDAVPSAAIAAESRRRRELTEGFLEVVTSQYQQYVKADQSPLKELAKDYRVNPSTVSRWIRRARDGGLLD